MNRFGIIYLCTNLNQKYAADFFGTVAGNISQLIANKGKVKNKYTLVRVI